MSDKTYEVVYQHVVPGKGWETVVFATTTSYSQAGQEASRAARMLDGIGAGNWYVDIYGLDAGERDGLGSYYQLFPGRLS
jgi:hypothetical protein